MPRPGGSMSASECRGPRNGLAPPETGARSCPRGLPSECSTLARVRSPPALSPPAISDTSCHPWLTPTGYVSVGQQGGCSHAGPAAPDPEEQEAICPGPRERLPQRCAIGSTAPGASEARQSEVRVLRRAGRSSQGTRRQDPTPAPTARPCASGKSPDRPPSPRLPMAGSPFLLTQPLFRRAARRIPARRKANRNP